MYCYRKIIATAPRADDTSERKAKIKTFFAELSTLAPFSEGAPIQVYVIEEGLMLSGIDAILKHCSEDTFGRGPSYGVAWRPVHWELILMLSEEKA